MHQLLVIDTEWNLSEQQEESSNNINSKSALHSSQPLVHYSLEKRSNPCLRRITTCSRLPFQISWTMTLDVLLYLVLALSLQEKKNNRNRLDKEAAAIMFSARKFHTYFYGRQFKIYTDHKPLLGLLQSRKQPTTASPHKLKLAVLLSSYQLMYIEVVRVMVTQIVLADSHCQLESRMLYPGWHNVCYGSSGQYPS